EALQAWAGDRGWPRRSEQTPMEFARQLAESAPPLADEARTVTRFYVSIAYGQQLPADDCKPALERLWQQLTV
ncbi:MAG: DUF4129 domain-containing protein, partial [Opitutaceae bacterium]|nr:DUF4129 domain-containing protein [Verrucomicrobiales bacterium]